MGIEIIKAKCTGCGLCLNECPVEAIRLVEGCAAIDEDVCTLCTACVSVCPYHAIRFEMPHMETPDLSAYQGVWVFAEQCRGSLHRVSFELLGEGRKLADARDTFLAAVLFGDGVTSLADELIARGADRVYLLDDPKVADFRDDLYGTALAALAAQQKPEIILAGATPVGRAFIPRVAAELRTGLTADCTELHIDAAGHLAQTRPAFGGNIMATIVTRRHRPQMATVRYKVMREAEAQAGRSGEVIAVSVPERSLVSRVKVVESIVREGIGVNLVDADIIVSGGGGLGNPENFALIQDLADALGGAVGATRSAVDKGWIDYANQIGQTGKTVCPKLYVAVGISGAIQHIVGMKTSEKLLAINRDPHAPIFRLADYGLVGDLFDILPKLTADIRRLRAAGRNPAEAFTS